VFVVRGDFVDVVLAAAKAGRVQGNNVAEYKKQILECVLHAKDLVTDGTNVTRVIRDGKFCKELRDRFRAQYKHSDKEHDVLVGMMQKEDGWAQRM